MCIVIVVNTVWPIRLWRRDGGGGTVKKESKMRSKQLRITAIRGKTRCVLLQFDTSKRCVCPVYKYLYAFKLVKLFLKNPVYMFVNSSNMIANVQFKRDRKRELGVLGLFSYYYY
jgi:hypothetical protein